MGDLLQKEQKETLEAGIDTLSPTDQGIVRARFGIGRRPATLDEIAARLSFTKERVRQRELGALRMLRARTASYFDETGW